MLGLTQPAVVPTARVRRCYPQCLSLAEQHRVVSGETLLHQVAVQQVGALTNQYLRAGPPVALSRRRARRDKQLESGPGTPPSRPLPRFPATPASPTPNPEVPATAMHEYAAGTVGPANPQVPGFLPLDEHVASLARKRMAAGALFRDEDGRVLLVDPVYRDARDLPGGAVEAEESPHAACRREVAEELGLERPAGRVLAWTGVPSRPGRPEGLIVVYDGGTLSPAEIATLAVTDSELAGFGFVPPSDVATRVTPLVGSRISACLDAAARGLVLSLEAGRPA